MENKEKDSILEKEWKSGADFAAVIGEEATDLLENGCEFAPLAEPSGLSMLPVSEELSLIAGDASGGCFYQWHAQSDGNGVPIVYLSFYGEASRIGGNLREALDLIVGCPGYWPDVLTAAHKSMDLVRSVIQRNEASLDDFADIEKYTPSRVRTRLKELLNLGETDIAAKIWETVHKEPAFRPLLNAENGSPEEADSFANRPYPKEDQ